MGQTQANKKAIWLKLLLAQLDNLSTNKRIYTVIIYCDNQEAITLNKNLKFYAQNKHINI